MIRTFIKMTSRQALSPVKLTEFEIEFFGLINEFLAKSGRKTVVRVAGGWVRDKLLNKQSSDIDLALDDSMGAVFATEFTRCIFH